MFLTVTHDPAAIGELLGTLMVFLCRARPSRRKIGITGLTGSFDSLVFSSLLDNPDIKIRGLCRNAGDVCCVVEEFL
jgi:hypothetical protein